MISDKPALPQGEAKVRAVDDMFDAIAPRYDTLNRLLTLRMDVGWRKKTVRSLALAPGAVVLDLACGTGDLCRVLEGLSSTVGSEAWNSRDLKSRPH